MAAERSRSRAIELCVDVLAVYRLTRLVTTDTLTARVRARVIESSYRAQARREGVTLSERVGQPCRDMRPVDWSDLASVEGDDAPKLATLVTCGWCAGVWVAAGVVAARRLRPVEWDVAARALALAAGSSLLARIED